jgi:hypothetical protein
VEKDLENEEQGENGEHRDGKYCPNRKKTLIT